MNTTSNLGSKLKNSREAMRLSLKEAAERLRINSKFLKMLEDEAFDETLPITFLRGYLRSYSRLLNFTESEINFALNQLNTLVPQQKPAEKITPVLTLPKTVKKDKWHRVLTYIVIFTLILLVSLWWKSHSTNFNATKTTTLPSSVQVQAPANEIVAEQPIETPTAALALPQPEQKPAETPPPAPPIKTAQKPMTMAVPEEPGLDLLTEE